MMSKQDIFDALIAIVNTLNGLLALAHSEGLTLSPTAEVLTRVDGCPYIHIQLVTPEETEEDYADIAGQ